MISAARRAWYPVLAVALLPAGVGAQVAPLPEWMLVDTAARTLTLVIETAVGEDGAAGLNGFRQGHLQVVVPHAWTVNWTWTNRDSVASHSLVVMAEREKLPLEGGRPALENALSRAVVTGMKPGQRDVATFTADPPGWYWMLCGVPGHALQGEWIGLKIDREARRPTLVTKPPT